MDKSAEIDRKLLPPVLATILDVAGPEALRAILEQCAGCRVLIPMRAGGNNWLTRIVSREQAKAIIEALGAGIPIEMPMGTRWMAAQRMDVPILTVADLEARGLPNSVIARTLGVTERTVRNRKALARRRSYQA